MLDSITATDGNGTADVARSFCLLPTTFPPAFSTDARTGSNQGTRNGTLQNWILELPVADPEFCHGCSQQQNEPYFALAILR
jgi:hypothetical protein